MHRRQEASLRIMPQLAAILQALRACHIVHHDLKTDNIMLATSVPGLLEEDGAFELRVVDFGFANQAGQYHPAMGGTPGLMSLEVLQGARESQYSMDM